MLKQISQQESERIGLVIAIILFSMLMTPIIIGIIVTNVKTKKNNQIFNRKSNETQNMRQLSTTQIKKPIQLYERMPYYLMDSVMTHHETILFSILSDFCQKYKFVLLSKVRLADFIQPINTPNRKDYYHWFNRISAKHVDFLVCECEGKKIESGSSSKEGKLFQNAN